MIIDSCWRNIFRKKPRLDPRRVKGLPYSPAPSRDQAPVHLDVGGKQFTTSLSTLTSVPGSKIFDLFTGRLATVLDMKTNSYFIDRDGELFRFVLQFLRDGTLAVPDNFQVLINPYKILVMSHFLTWRISPELSLGWCFWKPRLGCRVHEVP